MVVQAVRGIYAGSAGTGCGEPRECPSDRAMPVNDVGAAGVKKPSQSQHSRSVSGGRWAACHVDDVHGGPYGPEGGDSRPVGRRSDAG
jgi:hypothetical protein